MGRLVVKRVIRWPCASHQDPFCMPRTLWDIGIGPVGCSHLSPTATQILESITIPDDLPRRGMARIRRSDFLVVLAGDVGPAIKNNTKND